MGTKLELVSLLIFILIGILAFSERKSSSAVRQELAPPLKKDIYLLARIIFAEAAGESYQGKVAVGCVIRNRVKDSRWANTYREVIYQPHQFSGVNSPLWYLFSRPYWQTPKEKEARQECLEIAEKIILNKVPDITGGANKVPDITGGANHYYNPKKVHPSWAKKMVVTRKIGNHLFLRE